MMEGAGVVPSGARALGAVILPNMAEDRMFHVLVLGGIALVGSAPAACGGDVSSPGDAGSSKDATEEFPSELPVFVDAGVRDAVNEFPSELPVFVDSGIDDAREEFPREGPQPADQ
jgi:hypothetical protein